MIHSISFYLRQPRQFSMQTVPIPTINDDELLIKGAHFWQFSSGGSDIDCFSLMLW